MFFTTKNQMDNNSLKKMSNNIENMVPEAASTIDAFIFGLKNQCLLVKLPRCSINEAFQADCRVFDAFVNPSRMTFRTNRGDITLKKNAILPFTRGAHNWFLPVVDRVEEASLQITPLIIVNGWINCEFRYYCADLLKKKDEFQLVTIQDFFNLEATFWQD